MTGLPLRAMLEKLRAFIERPDHPDEAFVRLESVSFEGVDGILRLDVLDYHGRETWSRWEVKATALRECRVTETGGDLSLHEGDHVLVRQHTDNRQELYFRGVPRLAMETVGRLLIAHKAIVGEWIPFERFLNSRCPLEKLLAGGFAQLADGPTFLVAAYAGVLASAGMEPNALAPRAAKWWDGERWVENATPLAALVVGDSYFVAERFDETPLGDRVG